MTSLWGFVLGNITQWTLGIRLMRRRDRAATELDQWLFFGGDWAVSATMLAIALWFVTATATGLASTTIGRCSRWRFHVRVYTACLFLLGSAAAAGMTSLASRFSANNLAWHELAPLLGVAAAWIALLAVTAWMQFYLLIIPRTRGDDSVRALCPVCRFDLAASVRGVCPECGWQVPVALPVTTPPAACPSPAAGPAPSTP